MDKSTLLSLPPEWQSWINENIQRACDFNEIADLMVRNGHFDLHRARKAIEEASDGNFKFASLEKPMPAINTSANTIQTADRKIDILLTLQQPYVVLLGNVLSAEECDVLVNYCEPALVRSPVVNDNDGTMELHRHRTSQGMMIQRGETEVVQRIEARLAELAQWPVDHGEGMQIQYYQKSNEYRPHFDWFNPELPGPRKHMEHGGQRLATFVLYLSDVESGGGTSFPEIGLNVLPKKGSAVFFRNTHPSYVPDPRTLHAGDPVVSGVKVIANKWLRERRY